MKSSLRPSILLALALLGGAAFAAEPKSQVQDGIAVRPLPEWRVLVSEEELDRQSQNQYLGLLASAQRQNALVPENHPQAVRLRAIAKRIMPFAMRWNPAAARWHWQVNLLASKQVNAFCMPGGRIAFYSGILTSLKLTDDEVAAVMGHEIAHALREHGRERMVKSGAANVGARIGGAIVSRWLGIDPQLTGAAADAGAKLVVLKFSRDDEREADLVGLDLAARAGFDPRAGVALWEKMAALNQRAPLPLLSTHPGGAERIADINAHLNVLLPVYARAKGVAPERLGPYQGGAPLR